MAIYKTIDLLNSLHQIYNDGIDYIDIEEADDDNGPYLDIEGYDVYNDFVPYECIDSCAIPESYDHRTVNVDEPCYSMVFSYNELFTIKCAVDNALEYFKEQSKLSTYSKETLADIKRSSINCRNLQAKLAHTFKEWF